MLYLDPKTGINDFLNFRAPVPQYFGYCVFGKVVSGMDVVDAIATVKTGFADKPVEDVVILGIDITEM